MNETMPLEEEEHVYHVSSSELIQANAVNPKKGPLLVFSLLYTFLFIVGTAGNITVLTCVGLIRQTVSRIRDNILIYVTVLCLTDLACLASLPMAIVDTYLENWIFGSALCRVYWILESGGKIFATFILTAVSFERYIGTFPTTSGQIGTPKKRRREAVRSARSAFFIVTFTLVFAVFLLAPLPGYAYVETIPLSDPFHLKQFQRSAVFIADKCIVKFSPLMYVIFNIYMFILGFIIPGFLMALFYGKMLWKLHEHKKRMPKSQVPLGVVARYTASVTTFYFLCLTPYWAAMIFNLLLEWEGRGQQLKENDAFVYMMYIVHALPYTNAAFNWAFYAALNSQVRRSYQEAGRIQLTSETLLSHQRCDSCRSGSSGSTIAGGNTLPPHRFKSFLPPLQEEEISLTAGRGGPGGDYHRIPPPPRDGRPPIDGGPAANNGNNTANQNPAQYILNVREYNHMKTSHSHYFNIKFAPEIVL